MSTLCLTFPLLALSSLLIQAQTAIQADALVDSVGVNIHLHNGNTLYYDNFPLVFTRLKALGVRHVREGLIDTTWTGFYDRLNQLGSVGIKASFTTSVGQSAALLCSYPSRVASSFEQYESPNEYDVNGGYNWSTELSSFLPMMYKAVKSNSRTSPFPIVGPSLVNQPSYATMAGVRSSIDYANLHNYFGGNAPGTPGWGDNGYGSINWNLNNASSAWPGKPVISSETGYIDDATQVNGISQDAIATYMPRVILEQFLHGIKRTYLYELADSNKPPAGLLKSDGTPKPSFTALQSLLTLLNDPGAPFTPSSLAFTLTGSTQNVDHMLLQKRNGTFYLLLWVEKQGYDVNAKQPIAISPQQVMLKLPSFPKKVTAHQFAANGTLSKLTPRATHSISLSVTDRVLALEIEMPVRQTPRRRQR